MQGEGRGGGGGGGGAGKESFKILLNALKAYLVWICCFLACLSKEELLPNP